MLGSLLLLLLVNPGRGRATEPCESSLDLPILTREEFYRLRALDPPHFSLKFERVFVNEALPELWRLATENDITIARLLEDLLATLTLYFEMNSVKSPRERKIEMHNIRASLENVERLIGRTKFKVNHHQKLAAIMSVLQVAGAVLGRSQITHDGVTRINPWGPFTRDYVTNLLIAADEGLLDRALADQEAKTVRFARQRREFDERRARARLEATPTISSEAIETPVASSEPDLGEPPPTDERNLAMVLKLELPLRTDWTYEAETSQALRLRVQLAPSLLKQEGGGQRAVVRRLLKGVLIGRDHAGVKVLAAVGPRIIEVKAVLHGHKRILGCLDGRELRLLRVIDIKADGSAYAKRIPRDLCS
jgi:hypothetical protein